MKKEERDLNFLSTQTDINNETNPFFWLMIIIFQQPTRKHNKAAHRLLLGKIPAYIIYSTIFSL